MNLLNILFFHLSALMLVGLLRLTPWATMSKLKISTVNDRERNLGERWCLYICLVKRLTKINNTLLWKATLVPCCDVRSEYFGDKLFRDKLEVCRELVRCDVFRAFYFIIFFFLINAICQSWEMSSCSFRRKSHEIIQRKIYIKNY